MGTRKGSRQRTGKGKINLPRWDDTGVSGPQRQPSGHTTANPLGNPEPGQPLVGNPAGGGGAGGLVGKRRDHHEAQSWAQLPLWPGRWSAVGHTNEVFNPGSVKEHIKKRLFLLALFLKPSDPGPAPLPAAHLAFRADLPPES